MDCTSDAVLGLLKKGLKVVGSKRSFGDIGRGSRLGRLSDFREQLASKSDWGFGWRGGQQGRVDSSARSLGRHWGRMLPTSSSRGRLRRGGRRKGPRGLQRPRRGGRGGGRCRS